MDTTLTIKYKSEGQSFVNVSFSIYTLDIAVKYCMKILKSNFFWNCYTNQTLKGISSDKWQLKGGSTKNDTINNLPENASNKLPNKRNTGDGKMT